MLYAAWYTAEDPPECVVSEQFTVYASFIQFTTATLQYRPVSKKHLNNKVRLRFSLTTRKRGASESSATLKPI